MNSSLNIDFYKFMNMDQLFAPYQMEMKPSGCNKLYKLCDEQNSEIFLTEIPSF